MSHTSRSVEKYSNTKRLFQQFESNFKSTYTTSYIENKDVCAICLSFKKDNHEELHFYYVYGSNTIVVVLQDDVRVITASNPDASSIHMTDEIEEWDKRNKLL